MRRYSASSDGTIVVGGERREVGGGKGEEEAEGAGEGAHSVVGRPWPVRQLSGHTMDGGESRRQPKVRKLPMDIQKGICKYINL